MRADRMRLLGAILAGGASRSVLPDRPIADKPLVAFAGQPLVARVLARIAPQVAAAVLVGGDPARLASFCVRAIDDGPMAGQGPLSGLHAALLLADREGFDAVLSVPCDMPFLPADLAARLAAGGPPAIAVSAGRMHHLVGMWPASALRDLAMCLAEPYSRSVEAWADRLRPRPVIFAGRPDPFFNVNTPADLARAIALAPPE
jgi:molybdopterin-guanine dinucleotide biosynthesis protein A